MVPILDLQKTGIKKTVWGDKAMMGSCHGHEDIRTVVYKILITKETQYGSPYGAFCIKPEFVNHFS